MKVTKNSLVSAIEDVLPIVKDTFVKSMSVICFDEDVIRSNNGSIGIASDLNTGLKCCVGGRKFFKILETLTTTEIDLDYDYDKKELTVTSGGFKAKLNGTDIDEYPIQVKPINGFVDMPKDLYDGLTMVRFSVSKDAMRPELCGISVRGNEIMSADGYRSTKAIIKTKLKEDILIHPTVIDLMLERGDMNKYSLTDNWIHLSNDAGNVTISCSLLGYKYPVLDLDFTRSKDCIELEIPNELLKAIERACIATEDMFLLDRMVKLKSLGDRLELHSGSARLGEIYEDIPLSTEIAKFDVEVNPMFLKESLRLGAKVYYDPNKVYLRFEIGGLSHIVVGEGDWVNNEED